MEGIGQELGLEAAEVPRRRQRGGGGEQMLARKLSELDFFNRHISGGPSSLSLVCKRRPLILPQITIPPLGAITWPVMNSEPSEQRKRTSRATS